jgi:UDP-3-O-[3-hydroxymyristoyl] glucosamine N-acyltransferase
MNEVQLGELASRFGLALVGDDRPIRAMDYVDAPADIAAYQLSYANSEEYLRRAEAKGIAACVTSAPLAARWGGRMSLLTATATPADAFFTLFEALVAEGRWRSLDASRGIDVQVASSASIGAHVILGDRCRIRENVVILPNTRIGHDVVIKPNAVIGGNGFEVRLVAERKRVVTHVGGVWLGDGVEIGSCTCVDRGIFGEFTTIGDDTKIDNLVHVAHRVVMGRRCSVVACAEVSGSVTLGDHVWIGPSSAINQGLRLGDGAFVGTGSVVTKVVPAHALVYGSPARLGGWRCHCHAKLVFETDAATCPACGREFVRSADGIAEVVS